MNPVIVAILVVLLILAAAAAVYGGVFYSRQNNLSTWVAESVDAWRSDELDTNHFDVQIENARVGDLFESFPQDHKAYLTPEDVEETWEQVVMLERDAAEHVRGAAAPVIAKVTSAAGKVPTKLPSRLRRSANAATAPETEVDPEADSLPPGVQRLAS